MSTKYSAQQNNCFLSCCPRAVVLRTPVMGTDRTGIHFMHIADMHDANYALPSRTKLVHTDTTTARPRASPKGASLLCRIHAHRTPNSVPGQPISMKSIQKQLLLEPKIAAVHQIDTNPHTARQALEVNTFGNSAHRENPLRCGFRQCSGIVKTLHESASRVSELSAYEATTALDASARAPVPNLLGVLEMRSA